MGRPKKGTGFSASIKIETAFWELIETGNYSKITIQKLADKAGVNRNAVYYHFENVDDVARKAFYDFMATDAVEGFVRMLLNFRRREQELHIDDIFVESVRKLQVCANSNSIYINKMLKNEIKRIWFRIADIKENQLETIDKLSVDFVLSGIIAMLGSEEVRENPFLMLEFPKTDIGLATLGMMLRLADDK